MTPDCRVLVLEDSPGDLRLLREMMTDARDVRFRLSAFARLCDALVALEAAPVDLILADLNLPDSAGLDTYRSLQRQAPDTPVILVTGNRDESTALAAVAQGAQDYLMKDGLDGAALVRAMMYAIERNRAEQERRQLVAILEATSDLVWTTSPTGTVRFLNQAARTALGLPADCEIVLIRLEEHFLPWAASILRDEAIPSAVRDGYWLGETALRGAGEAPIPLSQIVIAHRSAAGRLLYLSTIARDISERKQAEARLARLAHYDTLTGLPNRDLFRDRLAQAMHRARRSERPLALMFLDLDHFKDVNDTLGHSAGDQLLMQVASRLQACLRAEDTVARQGGDEFTILIESLDGIEALQVVLDSILGALALPFVVGATEVHVSASVGATLYLLDEADPDSLLRQADAAMYQAKSSGRNNFQFYSHELQVRTTSRLGIANDLRHALARGELFVEYQPQVDTRTGAVRSLEALLRWRHPREGLISPAVFVPIAEETGQIAGLGDWVLRAACRQCREWRDRGLADVRVSVNLSVRQLRLPNLVECVRAALHDTGLPPDGLEVEITESGVMENIHAGAAVLRELRAMGVTLAVDDFGTGYSSLAYLKHLPLDRLKIDRSFVQDLPAAADSVAIVRSILAMAHFLGLAVVAEGVETPAQFDFLLREGCDMIQGYLLARPMAAADAETLLRTGVDLTSRGPDAAGLRRT